MGVGLIIAWGIAGVVNLALGEISRFSYGIAWGTLMLMLILEVIR